VTDQAGLSTAPHPGVRARLLARKQTSLFTSLF